MKKFYFTFGQVNSNANRYQVIFAADVTDAHEKMFSMHGNRWCDSYTHDYWLQNRSKGYFKNLKPLKPAYAFKVDAA